jgi:15-cis-phytoene synthase
MDALVAASRTSIAQGSKSFALASRLFAPGARESAWLLYAWCRHCDDVIDGQQAGHGRQWVSYTERQARLETLYAETRAALEGRPVTEPAFAGLQRVAQLHDMPRRYPLELVDGFAMDVEGRHYASLDDTLEYCYHVAGVVGVMMAIVMGVRDEEAPDRARDPGIAFQLTNIARDLVEDAQAGRVYVPDAWLHDVPPSELHMPLHRREVAALAGRLVETAEPYYQSARAGLRHLPVRSAWAVAAALGVYREIGRVVVRRGARAWDGRVVVGGGRKLAWVARALAMVLGSRLPARVTGAPPREGLWTRSRGQRPWGRPSGLHRSHA